MKRLMFLLLMVAVLMSSAYAGKRPRIIYGNKGGWNYNAPACGPMVVNCPTITTSDYATQAITSTGAILHLHTSRKCKVQYRYDKVSGGSGWTELADTDDHRADSLQHTEPITGLEPDHVQYKWQSRTKWDGCPPSAWGNEQTFYTTCRTVSAVSTGAFGDPMEECNGLSVATNYAVGSVEFHYRAQGFETWMPTTGYGAGDCWTNGCSIAVLANSTTYEWQWRATDLCGTVQAWSGTLTASTNSSGYFTQTAVCGG